MTLQVSITLVQIFTKVRAFMMDPVYGVVPAGTRVIRGPINRAAQPADAHVIITPTFRRRLRTNVEVDVDPFPLTDPGSVKLEEGVQAHIQADFYGEPAEGWAQAFQTIWRSPYAVQQLAPECAPLYAEEARQIPLVTGEEQYLERWTTTLVLQYNPVTQTPQDFFDTATVVLVDVDERYPPS